MQSAPGLQPAVGVLCGLTTGTILQKAPVLRGGLRALAFYHRRSAVQASAAALDILSTPRAACGVTPLKGGGTSSPAEPVPRCPLDKTLHTEGIS